MNAEKSVLQNIAKTGLMKMDILKLLEQNADKLTDIAFFIEILLDISAYQIMYEITEEEAISMYLSWIIDQFEDNETIWR